MTSCTDRYPHSHCNCAARNISKTGTLLFILSSLAVPGFLTRRAASHPLVPAKPKVGGIRFRTSRRYSQLLREVKLYFGWGQRGGVIVKDCKRV